MDATSNMHCCRGSYLQDDYRLQMSIEKSHMVTAWKCHHVKTTIGIFLHYIHQKLASGV